MIEISAQIYDLKYIQLIKKIKNIALKILTNEYLTNKLAISLKTTKIPETT